MWDDFFWTGEVNLPSWSGFQTRRGAYGSVSAAEPSDGTARLSVEPMDVDSRTPPTPEQIAAFQHLLDNEASIAAAIGHALLAYYPGEREAYLDAYELEESDKLPVITEIADLRPLVGLSNVHVLSVNRDGVACIGFEFGCEWDDEHGAGVMTHRGRVIATGQADCSFVEWIAREGLDK
jgi:hypothetical protein